MPFNIIPPVTPPIPRFTPSSGELVGPADGDALLAASVNNPFAQVADRTTLAFTGLYGVYGSRLVASCSDGANIQLNNQAAVRSSSGVLAGSLGSPISIAGVLGSAPVADTWYYLYGQDLIGILTPVISTDPPEATLKYRTGNADQVFISMFKTDGSANVRLFTHYQGSYQYFGEVSVIARSDPGTVTWTAAPLPDIPPFIRQAYIEAVIYNRDPLLSASYGFRYPSSADYKTLQVGRNTTTDTQNSSLYCLPVDGQTGFEYLRSVTFTGTADVSAVLHGFPV